MKLSKKLEQLGADGRARLGRAWSDPELDSRVIAARFGFLKCDLARLTELLGARPPKPGPVVWRRRDDERKGVQRARR